MLVCLDHFVIAVGTAKAAKSAPMKHWQIALSIFAALSASLAVAEDFRTINGKEYKDAAVTRVEGDGIVLRTKTGISKVYFFELPPDVQRKFRPAPATPKPAPHQLEPTKLEAKQDVRPQADRGGRVVVVGQGALSLKVIVAGIIVLVGLVALIRSRFS